MARPSAKIDRQKRSRKKDQSALDTYSEKRGRGRPVKIQASTVRGRADNYRDILPLFWEHIWPRLACAQTQQDVIQSLAHPKVGSYALDLIRSADLILQVVRDPKFPKRMGKAQIKFMADSIAGYGVVTPRSSRDICERERARIKKVHRILCYEFYVECSCGYKGRSKNHACAKCQAQIQFKTDFPTDFD